MLRVHGADGRIRTGDLILTKDALYLLSYISELSFDNGGILPQEDKKCKRILKKKYHFAQLLLKIKIYATEMKKTACGVGA